MTVNIPTSTTGVPSGPEFGRSLIQRAWEAPEEVVFPRYIVDSPGLQAEDIGVLAHLLLRDPDQPSSVAALAAECQQRGWKISEYAMRGIVKRLKVAGHIHQDRVYNPSTGRLDWVFSVYRNPANNLAYASADRFVGSQQIGLVDSLAPNESAGQADSLAINETGASRWLPTNGNGDVSAGHGRFVGSQRIGAHPPHPPEEVETSSPYPLNTAAAPQEEAEAFTPEETAHAEQFLQMLPAPWAVGRLTARRQAPKLLEAAAAQGWDLDDALAVELTKNPGQINNFTAVLKTRIADLPLKAATVRPAKPARPARPGQPTTTTAWCGHLTCDEITRTRTTRDANGYMATVLCPDCHPSLQETAA